MEKVIVAVCEDYTKKLIKDCIKSIKPDLEIIDGTSDAELIYKIKRNDIKYIFFDKYFLSYILRYKLLWLKVYNPAVRLIFCELGDCSVHFALRVYLLDADAYFSNIEDFAEFKKNLTKVFSGMKYFPEMVLSSVKANDHLREKKFCSDITESEAIVGMYLGEGKTIKEICYLTKMAHSTVHTHCHRLKKKIGYKSPNDIVLLNRQLEKIYIRSWAC